MKEYVFETGTARLYGEVNMERLEKACAKFVDVIERARKEASDQNTTTDVKKV